LPLNVELRARHAGKTAKDIKPLAIRTPRRIRVSLSAELVAYAISRGGKYEFRLS
jgi:hypothetical protein